MAPGHSKVPGRRAFGAGAITPRPGPGTRSTIVRACAERLVSGCSALPPITTPPHPPGDARVPRSARGAPMDSRRHPGRTAAVSLVLFALTAVPASAEPRPELDV